MSETAKVVIIGSGPSGYTAGLYAARAQLAPILFAGFQSGGQLMWTSDIENFPGFEQGIAGPQLMHTMRQQAERFGTIIRDEYVTAVDFSQRPFKIWTHFPDGVAHDLFEKGTPEEVAAVRAQIMANEPAVLADAVIVSTGASSIMTGVPGEEKLMGKGVSTCAVCDAAFYKEKDTFVIGGGDSAAEDALALTKFAKSVTIIHRRDTLRASKIMQERVMNHPKIKIVWNSQIKEIVGDDKVTAVKVGSTVEGNTEVTELPADGVFIAIGHRPVTSIFKDQLELDAHGYIVTRQSYSTQGVELAKAATNEHGLVEFPTMTSVDGVFAAGDVVDVRYKQAVTAAGQGCAAAIDVERWLEKR